MKKIFLTGASGFVGTAFLKYIIDKNILVTALIRPDSGSDLFQHENITWIKKNLDEDLKDELINHDVVVHLAAHTANPPYASLSECIYWNVFAPTKLFESAVEAGINRFINIGSCFEYADGFCDEINGMAVNTPLGPVASYPTSKAAATVSLEGFARDKGIELTTLRLFQVYGEGESPNRLYPGLLNAARNNIDFPMSSGEQVRDFINVNEVAEKIFSSLLNAKRPKPGEPIIYHIATGTPTTVVDFSKKVWASQSAKSELLIGHFPTRKEQFKFVYSNIESIL